MQGGAGSAAGSYLGDDGELRTQVMEANVCHVESVDADLTLCGLQDSEQAESHGRLASPSTAHNAYLWGTGKVVGGISSFLSAPQWIASSSIHVLPTRDVARSPGTSTFSPPCTRRVRFFSTNSRPGRYRTE